MPYADPIKQRKATAAAQARYRTRQAALAKGGPGLELPPMIPTRAPEPRSSPS